MSTALRTFIREALLINELGGSMGQDMRYNPSRRGAEGSSQDFLLHPENSDNLAGKLYAIKRGGEPAFVVIADNSKKSQCIIKIYSKSNESTDTLIQTLNAKTLNLADKSLQSVLMQLGGWDLTQATHTTLQSDIAEALAAAEAGAYSYDDDSSTDMYLIVTRDLSKFYLPPILATSAGRDKAIKFECVMSSSEAISTVMDVTNYGSKEWFMAAACFYSYANGVKSAVFCALVGAALSAAGFGPVAVVPGAGWVAAGAAIIAGAAIGATFCDVVLRVPVLYWAAMNGKKTFAAANFAYMLISIAFQSLQAFKAAKAAPTSLKVSAVEFLLQISTSIISELNLPLSDSESMEKIREFIENPDMIKPALSSSETELIQAIRNQYPDF